MLDPLFVSAIAALGMAIVFSFVMYRISDRLERIVIASILIAGSILLYRTIDKMNGQPQVMSTPFDEVWVLGFHPDVGSGVLYLWLLEPSNDTPISYRVPYSHKMHKSLDKLRAKHKGKPYKAKMKGGTSITKPYNLGGEPSLLEIPKTMPRKGEQ